MKLINQKTVKPLELLIQSASNYLKTDFYPHKYLQRIEKTRKISFFIQLG